MQVGTHQQGTPAIQWEPMLFGGFKLTSPTWIEKYGLSVQMSISYRYIGSAVTQ